MASLSVISRQTDSVAVSIDFVDLHPNDPIVVAAKPLASGSKLMIRGQELVLQENIPAGHKFSICDIATNQAINKYGWPIGYATQPIAPGQHVHSHNLACDHNIDLEALATETPPAPTPLTGYTFQGFVRPNGKVGTRNYVAVISTVNCSSNVSKRVAAAFDAERLKSFPNIDGVVAFRHEGGCAMAFDGSKHKMLARTLGGIAKHPNIGGYVLIGLGCEQNTLGHLMESQKLVSIGLPNGSSQAGPSTIPVLSMQDQGGTAATIEKGIELVAQMLPRVNEAQRTTVDASHLVVGTECGGSDGYSGITANPAIGAASDIIVACGGTTILSETSEIYGAEQILTRRARSRQVAEKLLERIEWWKWYTGIFGEELDNNPSVGNKAGGLTTIVEKSLGAVSKAGTTALEAVYEYAEPITAKGLVIMDTPGFDPASVTGMMAGGANLIVFSTGRGSCFGSKPSPTIKVASNSSLYHRLRSDMDFTAGTVLEGETVTQAGQRLFEMMLRVASGEKTCSEVLNLGDDEFVPWTVGPTL